MIYSTRTDATLRDARLPFTVLLPDTAGQPIEVHDHSIGLRMALAETAVVGLLGEEWERPGVYILLDPLADDGSYGVYVGKAPSGVRQRVAQHVRGKSSWRRALLIQRATLHGLTSAHAGWLEGDLYQLFEAAEHARLRNTQVPRDDTVPSYDLRMLESFRDPIVRVLRLIGYNPDSADTDDSSSTPARRRATHHGVTVAGLIAARHLRGDERLVSTNGSWPASAQVNADGTISYQRTAYPTPSAAAAAVKGGAANGWDFWAVEEAGSSTRLATIRTRYQSAPTGER